MERVGSEVAPSVAEAGRPPEGPQIERFERMRGFGLRRATFAVGTILLVLAGCGGGGSKPAVESSVEPVSTITSQSSTAMSTAVTETSPTETEAATSAVAEAPCGSDAFLPILRRAFDNEAQRLRIVRADVERCQNGYAQVFAVPDASVCEAGVGYCYETEQVFLRWRGERWRIVTYGTGIECGFETDPAVVRICRALGYPDLATRSFQMPSGNIGCALANGLLRCDILSGLTPEPGSCELDWVGIILPADGTAEPDCAGDTVYDPAAPTFAYGWTWRRAGFTCTSRQAGLSCTSRAGHGFTLSREGWTAS